MAKERKSFFERLTGAVNVPEDEGDDNSAFAEAGSRSIALPSHDDIGDAELTVDVYQTDTEIVIKSTVAGVNPEDLDIAITNDMVTIRGKRSHDEEVKGEQYIYQECYWGAFSRSIILPTDVAADRAEATLHNGILAIHLPKIEKEQTKKLKVKPRTFYKFGVIF